MLLDSFEHAEADFAARLLIDARNEAESGRSTRPRNRCARRSSPRSRATSSRPASGSGSSRRWPA